MHLSSRNLPELVCQQQADPERFLQIIFDSGMVGTYNHFWGQVNFSRAICSSLPASVMPFSESTRFNDLSQIAVEKLTKPSTCTVSKSWDSSPVRVSAHAHEITDAVARELVIGSLREIKRFKNVWSALSSIQA